MRATLALTLAVLAASGSQAGLGVGWVRGACRRPAAPPHTRTDRAARPAPVPSAGVHPVSRLHRGGRAQCAAPRPRKAVGGGNIQHPAAWLQPAGWGGSATGRSAWGHSSRAFCSCSRGRRALWSRGKGVPVPRMGRRANTRATPQPTPAAGQPTPPTPPPPGRAPAGQGQGRQAAQGGRPAGRRGRRMGRRRALRRQIRLHRRGVRAGGRDGGPPPVGRPWHVRAAAGGGRGQGGGRPHFQLVGVFSDVSLNWTVNGASPLVLSSVNWATGVTTGTVTLIHVT